MLRVNLAALGANLLRRSIERSDLVAGCCNQQGLLSCGSIITPPGQRIVHHCRNRSCVQALVLHVPLGGTRNVCFLATAQPLRCFTLTRITLAEHLA